MEAIFSAIFADLLNKTCDVHHQKPLIETEPTLSIKCCCNDFNIICYKEVLKLLTYENEMNKAKALLKGGRMH